MFVLPLDSNKLYKHVSLQDPITRGKETVEKGSSIWLLRSPKENLRWLSRLDPLGCWNSRQTKHPMGRRHISRDDIFLGGISVEATKGDVPTSILPPKCIP